MSHRQSHPNYRWTVTISVVVTPHVYHVYVSKNASLPEPALCLPEHIHLMISGRKHVLSMNEHGEWGTNRDLDADDTVDSLIELSDYLVCHDPIILSGKERAMSLLWGLNSGIIDNVQDLRDINKLFSYNKAYHFHEPKETLSLIYTTLCLYISKINKNIMSLSPSIDDLYDVINRTRSRYRNHQIYLFDRYWRSRLHSSDTHELKKRAQIYVNVFELLISLDHDRNKTKHGYSHWYSRQLFHVAYIWATLLNQENSFIRSIAEPIFVSFLDNYHPEKELPYEGIMYKELMEFAAPHHEWRAKQKQLKLLTC